MKSVIIENELNYECFAGVKALTILKFMRLKETLKRFQRKNRFFRWLLIKFTIREKHLKGTAAHRLLGDYLFDRSLWIPSRLSVAKGIAIGLFFGMQPIYGFQILTAIICSFFLKGNISASVLATFVTNPFTTAPILLLQYKFGKWIISTVLWQKLPISKLEQLTNGPIVIFAESVIIGSILSGIAASLLGFLIVTTLWYEIGVLVSKLRKGSKRNPNPPVSSDTQ